MRDVRPKFKVCRQCGEEKPQEAFSNSKNTKMGYITLRSKCKACIAAIAAKKLEDPEARKKANAVRRKSYAKNPDVNIAAVRAWQRKNPKAAKAARDRWYKNHTGKAVAYALRRREHVRRATPPWANLREILDIYELAHYLSESTGVERHVDHIIPLRGKNVCGLHIAENLQILEAGENQAKGNLHESAII